MYHRGEKNLETTKYILYDSPYMNSKIIEVETLIHRDRKQTSGGVG